MFNIFKKSTEQTSNEAASSEPDQFKSAVEANSPTPEKKKFMAKMAYAAAVVAENKDKLTALLLSLLLTTGRHLKGNTEKIFFLKIDLNTDLYNNPK
ncbi:hypothetical protein L3081_02715 [Colwellia sp. MSW7]|uniref:Uncharacterized protein n=1 Tax=Colwellia maritima TaxID=2912588 RepID=A0ABS9WX06_9GAMM|nr:hypothetical protein [Colwellia maritima]MCI2282509.1 hypothetical protein [Colwellia maritima]